MRTFATAAIFIALAVTAPAAPIFYDDFNSYADRTYWLTPPPTEPTAPNHFGVWQVTRNTVDIHGPDWVYWLCGDGNHCVDLNGSYSADTCGTIQATFDLTPGWYVLSFDLGGSQRGFVPLNDTNDSASVSFGGWTQTFTFAPSMPFARYESPAMWLGGTQTVTFADATAVSDAMGILLDNISIDSIEPTPEPASIILLVAGLGCIAIRRRY